MSRPVREVLWHNRDEPEGESVEFRLTYAGSLRADRRSARDIAAHKQELRKHFHPQIRRLWHDRTHLLNVWAGVPDGAVMETIPDDPHLPHILAQRFQRCGYRFAP